MGGYRVTETTERLIINTYLRLQKGDPKTSAQQVIDAMEAQIKTSRRQDVFVPSLRKVQDILKAVRNRQRQLPPQETIQQQPWTMAALRDQPLPAESLPYVMQVWRYCCHVDEEFTIRQAKWVSRLCHFPLISPFTATLWSASYMYANKEVLSLASQKKHDSFLDDSNLVMTGLELQTYFQLNFGQTITDPFGLGLPVNKDHWLIEEAAHPIEYYNSILNGIISNKRDIQLINKLIQLPALPSLKLNNEMEMIYLSWFTHFRKSQHWPRITADQAVDVILALRRWATNYQSLSVFPRTHQQLKVITKKDRTHIMQFIDSLPTPDQALTLLSQYAQKEGDK